MAGRLRAVVPGDSVDPPEVRGFGWARDSPGLSCGRVILCREGRAVVAETQAIAEFETPEERSVLPYTGAKAGPGA
jgi:hypothetical protein